MAHSSAKRYATTGTFRQQPDALEPPRLGVDFADLGISGFARLGDGAFTFGCLATPTVARRSVGAGAANQ
ncbi:MAG: hypothetical protein OXG82_21395 [Gammaproteobacteria bacterium]|nr:hypothetical protein [Gammaproteobacteria bacterium]